MTMMYILRISRCEVFAYGLKSMELNVVYTVCTDGMASFSILNKAVLTHCWLMSILGVVGGERKECK